MRRKADAASRIARRWFFVTLALALVLMAAGVAVELSLSKAIVGPVAQLTDATTRLAGGELDTTVPVQSADEIGTLAVGFNRMAERIRELRRSDLGKLLVAQQTTEAAIDSLYDPVIVTDSERPRDAHQPGGGAAVRRASGHARQADRRGGARRRHRAGGRPTSCARRRPSLGRARPPCCRGRSTARAARSAIRSTPMRDADGRLVGAVTLLEDITHLSEVSRLKSEFIAAASHELRTPLTSVQMGIHLLLEDAVGHAERAAEGHPAGLSRRHRAARSPDAGAARSVEDRVGRGDAGAQLRSTRPAPLVRDAVDRASAAGRGAGPAPGRRRAAGPAARVRRSQPDRARHRQSGHQRDARDAGRRHASPWRPRARDDEVAISVTDTGVGDPARLPREDLRAVRAGAARVGRRRRARPDDLAAGSSKAHGGRAQRAVGAGTGIDVHVHGPAGGERQSS